MAGVACFFACFCWLLPCFALLFLSLCCFALLCLVEPILNLKSSLPALVCLALSFFALLCLAWPCFALVCLALPCLALLHLAWPYFTHALSVPLLLRFTQKNLRLSRKNFETPLLKELSRSSQDSFESESDSKESRDDRLNSFKSGICFFSIRSIRYSFRFDRHCVRASCPIVHR